MNIKTLETLVFTMEALTLCITAAIVILLSVVTL